MALSIKNSRSHAAPHLKKLLTYSRYLYDYLKYGDIASVVASMKYVVNKTSHSSDRIVTTSAGTYFCRKNTNDFQFANFYYEWGVKKFLLDRSTHFNVFIDGGACTGEYCVLLAKKNIRCIAFEPVETTFDVLSRNLELNKLTDKVKAYKLGLGEQNVKTGFVFNPVNTGASHMADVGQVVDCSVDIRTFDSIYPELGLKKQDRIVFKLDIEGMEPAAIRGAANFIREFPDIMFVMEDKHSGNDEIKETLNGIAPFGFGVVDEFNIYARKLNK